MLEGLDKINWSNLQHAYGSADDVPDLIRALVVDDNEVREKTLYALYGNIWHQGTVYQATSYAVPFLIELLQIPQVPNKHDILLYLAHLAHGYSYLDIHNDMPYYDDQRDTDEFRQHLRRELLWVKQAHDAVYKGLELYFSLLTKPEHDLSTRLAVPYVLARFAEHHQALIPRLLDHLRDEPNRLMRSSIILALRHLYPKHGDISEFEPYFAPDEDWIVRACSAMAMAAIGQVHTPLYVVSLLIDLLKAPDSIDVDYEQLTWSEGDVVGDVCTALMHVGYSTLESSIKDIVGVLRRVDFYGALNCIDALLFIVFDGKPLENGSSAHYLNGNQRLVLQTIVDSPNIWRMTLNDGKTMVNGNISSMMRTYGLPTDPDEMRQFLLQ